MNPPFRVVCTDCGHNAAVNRAPKPGGSWRCGECGGIGLEASDTPCHGCGVPIPAARLAAVPQSHHCTRCASHLGGRPASFAEPLGSREEFMRDRNSWRR